MVYVKTKLDLNEKQLRKALKNGKIRVLNDQIARGDSYVSLHPENAKKVEKALMKGTGCDLCISEGEIADTVYSMKGKGIFGDIWKGIKSTWNVLKDSGILTAAADAAVAPLTAYTGQPAAVLAGRKLLKQTTGVGFKNGKQKKKDMIKGSGLYLS